MDDLDWDESRCTELEQLVTLLNEVEAINAGSHCLERIARCIELARSLNGWAIERANFRKFLAALAVADRTKRKESQPAAEPIATAAHAGAFEPTDLGALQPGATQLGPLP